MHRHIAIFEAHRAGHLLKLDRRRRWTHMRSFRGARE
jgi:hypothetical protein